MKRPEVHRSKEMQNFPKHVHLWILIKHLGPAETFSKSMQRQNETVTLCCVRGDVLITFRNRCDAKYNKNDISLLGGWAGFAAQPASWPPWGSYPLHREWTFSSSSPSSRHRWSPAASCSVGWTRLFPVSSRERPWWGPGAARGSCSLPLLLSPVAAPGEQNQAADLIPTQTPTCWQNASPPHWYPGQGSLLACGQHELQGTYRPEARTRQAGHRSTSSPQ